MNKRKNKELITSAEDNIKIQSFFNKEGEDFEVILANILEQEISFHGITKY